MQHLAHIDTALTTITTQAHLTLRGIRVAQAKGQQSGTYQVLAAWAL